MPDSDIILFNSNELLAPFDPNNRHKDYLDLLLRENRRLNLVSRETGETGLISLYSESLVPLSLLESDNYLNYLDIGSGGGFPSIPIALSGRVKNFTICERIQKKASALRRISLALDLNPAIEPVSLEQAKFDSQFDLVTMRLVTLDAKLLVLIANLIRPGGHFAYFSNYSEQMPESVAASLQRYQIDGQSVVKSLTLFKKLPH